MADTENTTRRPANQPAIGFTRRALVAGAAFTAAAAPALAYQGPVTDEPMEMPEWWRKLDPHHAWFDEWKRIRSEYLRDGITDGDENEHGVVLLDRAEALADQIAKTQARTIDGVAAQLDWIDKDSDGLECLCPLNVAALRNAVSTLRGGLV